MSLISVGFVFLLPIVVGINFLIRREYRYIWLFLVSSCFYLSNDVRFFGGMVFCILTTYAAACMIEKSSGNVRKLWMAASISANVLLLLGYRYADTASVLIPLGVSFYSLQAMGYVVDVYRGHIQTETNFIRYALFVNFFPTVISGPIQRGTGLLQQLKDGRDFDYDKAHTGLYYLLWGYLLKFVIADPLSIKVNYAFDRYETLPGATLLWAVILYAVQLYSDFAAYSVLAVGTGKILGFDLKENFVQPYFAASIKEFWKRWHISLSSWLKDYVYISLGGNRKGICRTYLNLMITFLVSGIWHGTGLNFLAWGAFHGVFQIAESLLTKRKKYSSGKYTIGRRIVMSIVTFVLVDFAWLFFRAESIDQAIYICKKIVFEFRLKEMTYYGSYLLGGTKTELLLLLLGICVVFIIDIIHEKGKSIESAAKKCPVLIRWSIYIVLTLLVIYMAVSNYGVSASTFVYERF